MKDYTDFYKNIPKNETSLKDLLQNENLFSSVPKNWHILVTDIQGSSNAVTEGKHNDVNLTATGSIIAVLNAVKKIHSSLRIPYFFGGDGATFIVPSSIIEDLMNVLTDYSLHIKRTLNLDLRVGSLVVDDVYQHNYSLRISKLKVNNYLTTPVILGNGLKYAESKIKEKFNKEANLIDKEIKLDLEGMECRWDEIYPSGNHKKVACLLIGATSESKQAEVFNEIMNEIDYIFGNLNKRNPITVKNLKLKPTLEKIRKEMHTRIGVFNRAYLMNNWLITFFGQYYFKFFKAGKLYLYRVTQLSDTIMLDGSINTVISGDEKQLGKLRFFLDTLESQNKIVYGFHKTYASIMSCYVEDREKKHIHFVDGTEGGYTAASVEYKLKLRKQYISNF
ncbi:DUF3095 domain-containing protein [Polaribacter sp. Hel_I_88]|uniref:DUF3095 domain-containing protein n=1 Tax=Polaribacter sp. Hel_I_88 TaxID=1250006 RepID=UPI00047B16A2|nr:DUF3095 domain-containing protein [Polaribacter sp. Hel_I_88]